MNERIKKLYAFDFDGTLCDSPMPDDGKRVWKEMTGVEYPYKGWWGRAESLDLNVFDIKMFDNVLNILNNANTDSDSYVIILTSRMEKLRPQLQAILDANNIHVDKLDMKKSEKTKGEKILDYVREFPSLTEINVYDDRDSDILSYEETETKIPNGIKFNIFLAENGSVKLINNRNLSKIVNEEVRNFIKKLKGLYL